MMSTWFPFRSFLLVVLITDISCFPLQTGLPQSFPQRGSNTDATNSFVTHLGAPSNRFSPPLVSDAVPASNIYMSVPNEGLINPVVYGDPVATVGIRGSPQSGFTTGVSVPAQPVYGAGFPMPVQAGYAAGVSVPGQPAYAARSFGQPRFSAGSPVAGQSGYATGSSMPGFASAASSQPGVAARGSVPAQPAVHTGPSKAARQGSPAGAAPPKVTGQAAVRDIDWMVPPPNIFTSSKETSAPGGPGSSHGPLHAHAEESPFLPEPLRPVYQPGELSHFQKNAESGNYQKETEEIGYPPPSPSASFLLPPDVVFSPVGPHDGTGGFWGRPYPYFDYMFMTGQYPPGTVSHFSQNFEHGRDFYHDIHYNKEAPLFDPDGQNRQTPQQTSYVKVKQS